MPPPKSEHTQLADHDGTDVQHTFLLHLLRLDDQSLPNVKAMDLQPEIDWHIRQSLLDFLIETHLNFQLQTSTLFLAINTMDRYCSQSVVYKKYYQMLGCVSLLIAAKYNERREDTPTLNQLDTICDYVYDPKQFAQMELHVLSILDWSIGRPTVEDFLQISDPEQPFDCVMHSLTLMICEIAIYSRGFISLPSSKICRAARAVARCLLCKPCPLQIHWIDQYDMSAFVALFFRVAHPPSVVQRKYSSGDFYHVSIVMAQFFYDVSTLSNITVAEPQQSSSLMDYYVSPPATP